MAYIIVIIVVTHIFSIIIIKMKEKYRWLILWMMCYTIKRKEESMKILLVEDNESIIKGLEFSLKENGYEVTVRKDVNSTIVFLEHNKVDFIILDVLLPDGNGFSLYQNQI